MSDRITIAVAVEVNTDLPFDPKWIVADGIDRYVGGHVIASFSSKRQARQFVKHAGYHPSRLTVHRILRASPDAREEQP